MKQVHAFMTWCLKRKVLITVLLLLCFVPALVHAAGGVTPASSVEASKEILYKILQSIVLIEQVLFALITPAIALIGMLLGNDWVVGTASGLDVTMETMWVFVRNLVNICFVIVLLVMAFMHIVKSQAGDVGDYGIKSMLPNIVIAVVVVNFSLLGCRLILDASSLLTSAVFSIPNTVTSLDYPFRNIDSYAFTWTDSEGNLAGCLRPHYYFNIDRVFKSPGQSTPPKAAAATPAATTPAAGGAATGGNVGAGTTASSTAPANAAGQGQVKQPVSEDIFVPMVKCENQSKDALIADKKFFITGASNELYCEGKKFTDFYSKTAPKAQQEENLRDNCILDMDSLLFNERNAMYAFAYGLLNLPNYEKVLKDNITIDNLALSTIISVIMLAVIMMVIYAITIALLIRTVVLWGLMVSSPLWVMELIFKGGGPLKGITEKASLKSFVSAAFMPVAVGAVLSLSFIMLVAIKLGFAELGLGKNELTLGGMSLFFGDNPVMAGFGSIQDFIFSLLVIAVLWTAVFAALKIGDVTGIVGKAISNVENIGKEAAQLAGKLPGAIPIIPVPGKRPVSMNSIQQGLQTSTQTALNALDKQAKSDADRVFGDVVPWYRGEEVSATDTRKLEEARAMERPQVKDIVNTVVNVDADVNHREVREALRHMLTRAEENGNAQTKEYLSSETGKKFAELLRSDVKLSERDLTNFINTMGTSVLTGAEKAELLSKVRAKMNPTGATPAASAAARPITQFVTTRGAQVYVNNSATPLSGVTANNWGILQNRLGNYKAADASLITSSFVNSLVNNGRLRTPAEAAQALQAAHVTMPTGDALNTLAHALYADEAEANTFITALGGTPAAPPAPAAGTTPPARP